MQAVALMLAAALSLGAASAEPSPPVTTTPLVEAIKSGDTAAAVRLLGRRVGVNTAEPDGTTALHWAASRNDLELVRRLLRAGANAKARNHYGATPMSEAAVFGNAAILELLLKAGADVESPNADGQTALMLVARTSHVDAAALLLKHGASVNAKEGWKDQTPLMWAAAQRQPAMVTTLIAHGADVNARSRLHEWKRQVTAEPRALHRPAGGLTPLLYATREGCIECVTALAGAGADLNLGDPEEISPLIVAILNGHYDLASYLIDRGANIQKWDLFGRTPLYAAVDMNTIPHGGRPDGPRLDETTSLQIIEKLLAAGANPNAQLKLLPPMRNVIDDRAMDAPLTIGATPLLRAAKGLDAPAIALLLKHGARVDLPNVRGMTPVMVAAGLGSTDADSRGLYTTKDVQQRSRASLTLLLDAGAEINRKDGGRGLTALHEAARWGWNDVVTFLVERGADIDAADVKGLTPIDSALGKAGGNSRFGQRIDVFEETAALLRQLKAAKGKAAPVSSSSSAPDSGSGGAQQEPVADPRPPNATGQTPAFPGQTDAPEQKLNVAYDIVTIAEGLQGPWGLAFLPDGRMLVTEKAGNIRIIGKDGQRFEPLAGVPPVAVTFQGGLLDIAIDPEFAKNQAIYWSYSEPREGKANTTAVARARLTGDAAAPKLENVEVIFRQEPSLESPLHFGSRLVFGRDRTLFVTLGERSIPDGRAQAQKLDSLLGKIARINRDGTVPKDNPFTGKAGHRPEIWSYGHRNVQAAALNPRTGELWVAEHGTRGGDELNVARKGKDYGWPAIAYGIEYQGGPITGGITAKEGMEQPLYYWDPVIAPSGMAFYTANLFPAWKGSVFIGGLSRQDLVRLSLEGGKVVGEERLLTDLQPRARIRDVRQGPDGALYVLTDGPKGRLLKIVPRAKSPSQ